MMILLAHPGTQHSARLAGQLMRHDALYEFWTGFALTDNSWLANSFNAFLPAKLKKKVANRVVSEVSGNQLRTMPLVEWKALKQLRRGLSSQQVFLERNRAFQENIPDKSIRNSSSVIGFDTSSWILAERAENFRKPFFLDQSISHPLANEKIMKAVCARFPAWQNGFEERLPEVLECEQREYRLARKIVVASSFSKQTLISQGIDEEKIVVNPYGVDLEKFYPAQAPLDFRPLRFLFLGSVSARKGVPLLLEAWRALALQDSELWLVGHVSDSVRSLIPQLPGLKVLGKQSHRELPEVLRQCDVLVFPSYCEGFALVLLEALASGLPVITTEATAGPDLIRDGIEGRLIPSGDLEALCEAMRSFVGDPEKLRQMSMDARRAAERFSWNDYGDRWQRILMENV